MQTIKLTLLVIAALCLLQSRAFADSTPVTRPGSKELIESAIREYQAGNLDKAALILQQDLEQNPDDGITHFYLGMVKKKLGENNPRFDSQALDELEWAARLCPKEVIQSLTKQAVNEKSNGLPKVPVVISKDANWLDMVGMSMNQVFGGKKPEAKVFDNGLIELPPQDLFDSIDQMWKQGKRSTRAVIKGEIGKQKQSQYKSWAADVMPMDDMMDLVDKSKSINDDLWASHPDGLMKFHQAPENIPEWDFWIDRYKSSFQHVLTKYLALDASNQVSGKAACIFSIDKNGNLRGHIYASTGDGVLNRCLLKTIKTMSHSRVLAFPSRSKIEGFNFRMTWNYGKILHYIRAYKKYREAVEKQAQEELVALKTAAELRKAQIAEAKGNAEKLKALREKHLAQIKQIRTKVHAQLLPPAQAVQLKAVALSLKDVRIKDLPDAKDGVDPFSDIPDREIMSWPDLNR